MANTYFFRSYLKKTKSQLRALVQPCSTKTQRWASWWPPCDKHPSAAPSQSLSLLAGSDAIACSPVPCGKHSPAARKNCCCSATSGRLRGDTRTSESRGTAAPLGTGAQQLLCGILALFEMITPWQGLSMIKKHLRHLAGKKRGEKGAFRASSLQRTQLSSLAACLVQGGFPWQICHVHTFQALASHFCGGFRQVESTVKMQCF